MFRSVWTLLLIWLVVGCGSIALAVAFFDWLPGILISLILLAVVFWVFGCIFTPAVPNRRCPKCGEDGLLKIKKGEPLGVYCEHCGFRDEQRYVAYLDEW